MLMFGNKRIVKTPFDPRPSTKNESQGTRQRQPVTDSDLDRVSKESVCRLSTTTDNQSRNHS